MSKKTRVTITMDEKVFKDFQRVLPSYITVSGIIDSLIREYMAGYYKFDWSVDEMFDVLRGKTTVTYLQKVHELGIEDFPQDLKDTVVSKEMEEQALQEECDYQEAVFRERKEAAQLDKPKREVKKKKGA